MSDTSDDFDEDSYIKRYADVALAVSEGRYVSGRNHFERHGRAEGRTGAALLEPSVIDIGDIPNTEEIETYVSPSFTTAPPEVRNEGLIPPALRERYRVLWNQNRPESKITCRMVSNVIVDGRGLVFDRNLNLIRQTIHQSSPVEIDSVTRRVRNYILHEPLLAAHPGTTLLCEKSGLDNFGHWLIEMLPVAYLNLEHLHARWRLRLPQASTSAMNRVIRDSTTMLGVPSARVDLRMSGPQRYERLIIVQGLSHHGICYSPRAVDCMNHLASEVPLTPGFDKIWVTRVGLQRSILNEPAICNALTDKGWKVVNTGEMTLEQQISIFKGARHIAGVNGAGLTGLVFAPESAQITSFMPARMPDVFFWMLSGFKGQQYREVRCRQMNDTNAPNNWNCPLLIDVSEVLEILA